MKRIITAFCLALSFLFFFCTLSFAYPCGSRGGAQGGAQGRPTSSNPPPEGPCSGSTTFYWPTQNVDVTVGGGCSEGDSEASAVGTPALVTDTPEAGDRCIHINAQGEGYEFDTSLSSIINTSDFKMTFELYVVSMPTAGENTVWLADAEDGNNNVCLALTSGGLLYARYEAQGLTPKSLGMTVSGDTGQWLSIEYQLKVGTDPFDHYLNVVGVGSDEDNDDPAAMSEALVAVLLGTGGTEGFNDGDAEFYIKNVRFFPCDRY